MEMEDINVMGFNNTPDEKNGAAIVDTIPAKSDDYHHQQDYDDIPDKKEKEDMKTVGFFQVFRYAGKLDVVLMIFGTLFACVNGACLPSMMVVFGDMTDAFITSSTFSNNSLFIIENCNPAQYGTTLSDVIQDLEKLGEVMIGCNQTELYNNITGNWHKDLVNEISVFAIYFFIIGGVVLVAGYCQLAFWRITSFRQAQIIRTKCFRHIMKMEIGWFDTHEVGQLNTRLSDDVNKLSDGIGEKIGNFFQWIFTFLTGIIIGFIYGWKLALVIMATSPLIAASGGFITWVMSAFTKSELKSYAKAGAIAEEVFGAIRTVTAFSGQEKEAKRYGQNLHDARSFGIKKAAVSGGGMGVVYLVIFGAYALAFWYGSKLVQDGEYSIGQMLIVFFSVMIGAYGLGNAAPNIQSYATARGAAYALWELLDRDSEIDSSSAEGSRPESIQGNISFQNVKFNYPSRPDVQVLNGLSIDINKGQTVALVGSSGCGKSTTVQLLQRFYDPLEGNILIDNQDIKNLNITWLRQHIGLVSQEPVLFATTIKENIQFGRDDVTADEIIRAAQAANAHDFISKLPQKYDTLVGERGAQLSGGQKQRIAIARALIRDPKILLLDEATSALDTESEAIVQSALDKARLGRTTLVIAHRLSTIKTADHIYSLQDGKVFEGGSHDELMAKGESGIYYHLVMNQQLVENEEDDLGIDTSKIALEEGFSLGEKRGSIKRGVSRVLSKDESKKEDEEEEEENLPDASMTRLMRMNSPEWFFILLGCVSALVNGAVMPAFAVIFAEIIGVFAKPPEEQQKEANFYSAMFLVIGIVSAIAMFAQGFLFGVSGENLTVRIRGLLFSSYIRQEIGFFDDHSNGVGALCTRLSTDASAVQGATGVRLGSVLRSLSSIGTGLAIGFIYSWKLTLLIIGFIPFVAAAGAIQMKVLGGQSGKKNTALEEAGKVAIEAIENIRVVASLTKEPYFIQKYARLTEQPHKASIKKSHLIGLAFSFSQSLIYFAHGAAFYLGAYLVVNDNLRFDDMFKVFVAIVFSAMAVGEASAFAPDYSKAKVSAARIFRILDSEPSIDSASEDGIKLGDVKGDVNFNAVEFCYPTRPSVKVLKGLDLQVQSGQKVALVGSSGCGKSTVVSLLERFYAPSEGIVTIDGQPLKDINVQSVRSKLGIVQQEPILFDTSIRENIAYGDNFCDNVSMDRIIQAAKEANIHSFIANLPDGYETNVGDKGAQLSGGQKQRVAIARAIIRNPKILLLDEATSALDTESEKVVQEALEHAQEGRTSIVIAHRLSTIQDADSIVVIDNGEVAEKGSHSELLSLKGLYYNLQLAQQKKI